MPILPIRQAIQRTLDFTIALFLLMLVWPLLPIIVVLIRLESPGPAIFLQSRTGRMGRPFLIYKFRTMALGTPEVPTREAPSTAVTRLGWVLRRTKLDELPQIFNVLQGTMSLVGPRPCLLTQHQLIEARRQRGILEAKPGITGFAQALGIDMSDLNKLVEIETYYMRTRTLVGDLKIIAATLLGPRLLARPIAH